MCPRLCLKHTLQTCVRHLAKNEQSRAPNSTLRRLPCRLRDIAVCTSMLAQKRPRWEKAGQISARMAAAAVPPYLVTGHMGEHTTAPSGHRPKTRLCCRSAVPQDDEATPAACAQVRGHWGTEVHNQDPSMPSAIALRAIFGYGVLPAPNRHPKACDRLHQGLC